MRIVTRRTQTYEKDIAIGYDPFDKEGVLFFNEEERMMEYDPQFGKDIIEKIIELYTEESEIIKEISDKNSDDFDFDGEGDGKSRKRKQNLQFDIDEIMGMFDIDDFGNILLNKETMRDNLNRRVNKHGYLIDPKRNIIN